MAVAVAAVATLALGLWPADGRAATILEGKICIINAAARLPAIPAIRIVASRFTDGDPAPVIGRILRNYASQEAAARDIQAGGYAVFPEGIAERLRQSGGGDVPEFVDALVKVTSGAGTVELDTIAAEQPVTFSYACAWNASGSRLTAPTGIVR